MKSLLFVLLLPLTTWAQVPNTTPQTVSDLNQLLEADIRLRGPVSATGTYPTVKLVSGVKFDTCSPAGANCWKADNFVFNAQCGNTSSNCQPVANLTAIRPCN